MSQVKSVQPTDNKIPCIICDKIISMEYYLDSNLSLIAQTPFDRGVECRSPGNYGSQVHDLSGVLHFVICDECIIRNSHKMLLLDENDQMISARDHYDGWFKRLNLDLQDNYYKDIAPYFKPKIDTNRVE